MSLRLAIGTSLASKIASSALHILALPIAARSLGGQEFSLYVVVSSFLSWFMLANIGVAPALMVKAAEKRSEQEYDGLRLVFGSALFITFIASVLILVGIFVWTLCFDSHMIFGDAFHDRAQEIEKSFRIISVIVFFQLNASVVEAMQLGLQRQHANNIANIGGVVFSVISLLIFSRALKSTSDLLLALYVPQILWKLGNFFSLLFQEPSLKYFWRKIDFQQCKSLLQQGVRFSAAGPLNNFLSHALPIYLVGLLCLPEEAASYAVTINALILASGVLAMCTSPFIPILIESAKKKNQARVRKYCLKMMIFSAIVAATVFFSFYFFGGLIFKKWYGDVVSVDRKMVVAFCIYFVALAFEVTMYALLVGLGRLERMSIVMTLKSIAGAAICCLFLAPGRAYWPYLIFALLILMLEVLPFSRLLRRSIASLN